MPQVSVIVPLYNKEKWVTSTIDSVLAQTFRDFELIVVDDGSTDHSVEIVKQYADQRIRLIQQVNAGPGAARNKGLENANGEFVVFLDADDSWQPQFLATVVPLLISNTDVGAIISGYHVLTENKTILPSQLGLNGKFILPENYSAKQVQQAIEFPGWLFRKDAAIKAGGYYAKNHCTAGEDSFFYLAFLVNNPVYYLAECFYCYNTYGSDLFYGHVNSQTLPIATDIDIIKKNSPSKYFPVLDRISTLYMVLSAYRKAYDRNFAEAKKLLKSCPDALALCPECRNLYWRTKLYRVFLPFIIIRKKMRTMLKSK